MRSASAFRPETLRFPAGERLGAFGPPWRAADLAPIPFRGWGAGRRRLLSAEMCLASSVSRSADGVAGLRWSLGSLSSAFEKARKLYAGKALLCRRTVVDLASLSLEVVFGVPLGGVGGCLSGRSCSAATVALSGSPVTPWEGLELLLRCAGSVLYHSGRGLGKLHH